MYLCGIVPFFLVSWSIPKDSAKIAAKAWDGIGLSAINRASIFITQRLTFVIAEAARNSIQKVLQANFFYELKVYIIQVCDLKLFPERDHLKSTVQRQ